VKVTPPTTCTSLLPNHNPVTKTAPATATSYSQGSCGAPPIPCNIHGMCSSTQQGTRFDSTNQWSRHTVAQVAKNKSVPALRFVSCAVTTTTRVPHPSCAAQPLTAHAHKRKRINNPVQSHAGGVKRPNTVPHKRHCGLLPIMGPPTKLLWPVPRTPGRASFIPQWPHVRQTGEWNWTGCNTMTVSSLCCPTAGQPEVTPPSCAALLFSPFIHKAAHTRGPHQSLNKRPCGALSPSTHPQPPPKQGTQSC